MGLFELFAWGGDVGGATVIWNDDGDNFAMVVSQRDI